MKAHAKPLPELIARRPQAAQTLRDAANSAGTDPARLFYPPLTSSKVKEWRRCWTRGSTSWATRQ